MRNKYQHREAKTQTATSKKMMEWLVDHSEQLKSFDSTKCSGPQRRTQRRRVLQCRKASERRHDIGIESMTLPEAFTSTHSSSGSKSGCLTFSVPEHLATQRCSRCLQTSRLSCGCTSGCDNSSRRLELSYCLDIRSLLLFMRLET